MRAEFISKLMLDRHRFGAAEPKDVFDAVVKAVTACEDDERIVVLNTHEPYVLHVSGYIKNVRSCVARAMRQFKNDFDFHVRPDPVSKMLATITLTPKLNKSYDVRKDMSGNAVFVDGPYKGRQVAWSRRVKSEIPGNDTQFSVKPDIWNGSFYGWVAVDDRKRVAADEDDTDVHFKRHLKERREKPTPEENKKRVTEITDALKKRMIEESYTNIGSREGISNGEYSGSAHGTSEVIELGPIFHIDPADLKHQLPYGNVIGIYHDDGSDTDHVGEVVVPFDVDVSSYVDKAVEMYKEEHPS